MHSSRMHTACSLTVSRHNLCMPPTTRHTPWQPCMPPCNHTCPPQPCMPPGNHACPLATMHAPSNHACPLQPCTPPTTTHVPTTMHAPHNHACPPATMHALWQPCMPPGNHAPPQQPCMPPRQPCMPPWQPCTPPVNRMTNRRAVKTSACQHLAELQKKSYVLLSVPFSLQFGSLCDLIQPIVKVRLVVWIGYGRSVHCKWFDIMRCGSIHCQLTENLSKE